MINSNRIAIIGGMPTIKGTRILVATLAAAREEGLTDSEILQSYPPIEEEDLAEAWEFLKTRSVKGT